jgi:uncharacterized membrane protein YdbT with pleckstrin-like domain
MRTSGRLGIHQAQQSAAVSSSRRREISDVSPIVLLDRLMASTTLANRDGEEVLFEGRAALVPSFTTLLAAILTLGLWLLVRWFRTLGTSYRITTHRIVVETGVLSKKLEQIDLYRVADYTVERPFGQRIMGTGNLLLKTFDKTTPELNVLNIKTDVVKLYESVRAATEADKARRGVRMVDYESATP